MPINYISTEDAINSPELCMTVVSSVPSPWGEAAKGILHVKNITWNAVRFNPMDRKQIEWAGGYMNAPTLVPDAQRQINGWENIQAYAETASPSPALIPAGGAKLCRVLSEKFCGRNGLGWHRRLLSIHAGLNNQGGFAVPIAQYLAAKYGYSKDRITDSITAADALITEFVARLNNQKASGSPYYIGETLSYVDIYSACFMAMYAPLPEDQCAIHPKTRAVFEQRFPEADQAFAPILLEHRDYIYAKYLELPLSL